MLGRAGSGKTMAAMRLVLDLLATRTPNTRAPVIASLGSWNPASTPQDLLIHHLICDHPWIGRRPTDSRAWQDASVVRVRSGNQRLAHVS